VSLERGALSTPGRDASGHKARTGMYRGGADWNERRGMVGRDVEQAAAQERERRKKRFGGYAARVRSRGRWL
jgi:hypothetical protein